jgi:hypothetical protein
MEQTVYSKDEKNLYGIMCPKAEPACQYQTKEQACLSCTIESEVIWIKGICCQEKFEFYPREVWDYTGYNNPDNLIFFQYESI